MRLTPLPLQRIEARRTTAGRSPKPRALHRRAEAEEEITARRVADGQGARRIPADSDPPIRERSEAPRLRIVRGGRDPCPFQPCGICLRFATRRLGLRRASGGATARPPRARAVARDLSFTSAIQVIVRVRYLRCRRARTSSACRTRMIPCPCNCRCTPMMTITASRTRDLPREEGDNLARPHLPFIFFRSGLKSGKVTQKATGTPSISATRLIAGSITRLKGPIWKRNSSPVIGTKYGFASKLSFSSSRSISISRSYCFMSAGRMRSRPPARSARCRAVSSASGSVFARSSTR